MKERHHSRHIERGPAKYFHGRSRERDSFERLLYETTQEVIGSSVLIQGPPGVGKSALIDQHQKQAKAQGWQTIILNARCLYDPKELFRRLSQNKKSTEIETNFSVDFKIFKFGFIPKTLEETNYLNESIISSQSTLLILDEVQTLEHLLSGPYHSQVSDFLNYYHNLESKHGFILLFGGLSHSKEILRSFGLSRFNPGCLHFLKPLKSNAERAIIHDWLTKEMKTPSDTTFWINHITQRTDCWPRHIKSYCNAFCDFLEIGEKLTDQRLKQVLIYGDDLKHTYYQQRCDGFHRKTRELIASAMQQLPEQFDVEDVIKLFSKKLSLEKANDLYQTALSKGLFQMDQDGMSSVPIPSLRSFLIEEYGL